MKIYLLLFGAYFLSVFSLSSHELKKPVIVVTDLYHPHQDSGDNFDLVNAYMLPNVELKAVLIDCHEPFRNKIAEGVGKGLYRDEDGPREPGFIPVQQLNYIFNQQVPYAVGPFHPMTSRNDKMEWIPEFQQSAIKLLAEVLQQSNEQLTIVSFGSLRILAVAYNRFPELMRKKVKEIHISAGTSNNHPDFLEWNVALDTNAFVSILESDIPIALYPCAAGYVGEEDYGKFNAFVSDGGNTYYYLESLSFINEMAEPLKQYFDFVYSREARIDYLSILDRPYSGRGEMFKRGQHMWETAIWMQVADLELVKRDNGKCEIIPAHLLGQNDSVFFQSLVPVEFQLEESGLFNYRIAERSTKFIYTREDPKQYAKWMNEAIPKFYIHALQHRME